MAQGHNMHSRKHPPLREFSSNELLRLYYSTQSPIRLFQITKILEKRGTYVFTQAHRCEKDP